MFTLVEDSAASPSQTLKRLQWRVSGSAALFLALFLLSCFLVSPLFDSWSGRLLFLGFAVVAIIAFSNVVFTIIERIQLRLERTNHELLALHQAGLDISSELALDAVLQKVVDRARQIVSARYGALAVYREDGSIRSFVTSGLCREERETIGDLPLGRGLLGLVLRDGERLRLTELSRHPASVGFPFHHPDMRSLLAVPVSGVGPYRGNLYVAEAGAEEGFTAEDEEVLARFATLAGLAVGNAHLHAQAKALAAAEERLRLAHEMHDGLAQVLAYVNTKAQAAREHLRRNRAAEAVEHLDQLASAAREVYGDIREAILGLRASAVPSRPLAEVLRHYVDHWQDAVGLSVQLEIPEVLNATPEVELQLMRIVQEALGNVRKHAHASTASVAVRGVGDLLELVVEDDGIGFDPQAVRRDGSPHFGLATMRERMQAVGGTLEIDSIAGKGSRVRARFPRQTNGPVPQEVGHAPADRR